MLAINVSIRCIILFLLFVNLSLPLGLAEDVPSKNEPGKETSAGEIKERTTLPESKAIVRPTPNTRDPLKGAGGSVTIDILKAAQEKKARDAARARGEITFDDLTFDIEKDGHFEDSMITPAIREMEGKVIRIRGFILPSFLFQQKGFTRFVLVRDNQECCFGPGAALYDCVMVEMESGKTADFTTRVVTVKGTFATETKAYRYPDGEPYAIFKIVASEVK